MTAESAGRTGRSEPGARAHAVPLLLLSAAVLIAFADVIGPARGLIFRDHDLVYRPLFHALASSLERFELPALTRANPSGVPFEQWVAVAYSPLAVLFVLFDFEVAYDLYVALNFFVLGSGAYLLAVRLGAARDEALLAAGVASFGGPILSSENLNVMLHGLAWAPWVYLSLHGVLARPSARGAGLLALATAIHVQGKVPELLLLDLLAALALVLAVRPRWTWSHPLALMGAASLAFGLASIELVPVLEALAGSRRGSGFQGAEVSGWALNPQQLVELIAPAFWAPPEIPFLNAPRATGTASDPPYLTSLYLGTALCVLAGARWKGPARALLITFFLLLVISSGKNTPLHGLLTQLPGLRQSRYAMKYLWLAVPVCAALAPLALRASAATQRLFAAGLALVLLDVCALLVVRSSELLDFLGHYLGGWEHAVPFAGVTPADFPAIAQAAMSARLLHGLIAAIVFTAFALAAARDERRRPLWRGLLAAAVVFDLAFAGRFSVAGADLDRQRLPGEIERVIAGDRHRTYPAPSRSWKLAEARHAPEHSWFDDAVASSGKRARTFNPALRRYLDLDVDGQSNRFHARVFKIAVLTTRQDLQPRIWARANVAFFTSWDPGWPEERVLTVPIEGEPPEHVYRVRDVRPYASIHTRWRAIDSERTTNGRLAILLADPADREAALLIDAPGAPDRSSAACEGPSSARLVEERSTEERIEIEVDTACESLVVASEIVHRGWTASIDGDEAPLYTAEVGYLGAQVPPGSHRVVFSYRSLAKPWRPVAAVSGLIILLLLIFGRGERRGAAGSRPPTRRPSPGSSAS